ncbi:MAG: PD40 domain-containing protein [Frankiaceae bacterium]|nr:PD40 domain-containing protein [Frankiaceae bacterium]
MTLDDFAAVRAVSDPQPSPDGARILYTVRTTDVANNRRTPATFIISSSGGAPRAFPSADASATEARWSPDGKHIAYVAGGQLWVADADGGSADSGTTPPDTEDVVEYPEGEPSSDWRRDELDAYALKVKGLDTSGEPNKAAVLTAINNA